MSGICPECERKFEALGTHWRWNENHRPTLSEEQYQVSIGLMMGDGSLDRHRKNPNLVVGMTSKKYLKYIDDVFGCLSRGIKLREENKNKNHSKIYQWKSRSHPSFSLFTDWYESGEKVWPEDIYLSPTVLKHWYCGDGSWDNNQFQDHIQISMAKESDYTDKVSEMFQKAGLPSPSNYSITEYDCTAQFTVEQSKTLWEYMGKPLPGFEYKWPDEYY